MELLVFVIFITVTGAQQSQMQGPENTLGVVGSAVTLRCSSSSRNCDGIDWQKRTPGASLMTVFKGPGTILSGVDKDRYSVNNSSGCDLVIRNVQLTDAGRFICSVILSSSQMTNTAYLIILEGHPKCTINSFEDSTVEGDRRQLTCEVTYDGANGTSLIWKGVDDAPPAVKNGNTLSRSYSVVASVPEVPSFTCVTSFAFETDENGALIRGLATNSISNVFCATPVNKVLYSVRNVTLSPSLSNYHLGTVITCVAKGHPSPTFIWQEIDNCGTWMDIQNQNGSQFTMTNVSSKRYRCVAINVVRGITNNATSREIQFNNPDFKEDSSTRPIVVEDRFGIGIGIGVGIGLLAAILLATAAAVVVILVRHRYLEFHPMPANKSPDGVVQHHDSEMIPSSNQRSSVDRSVPETEARIVVEEESAYACLEENGEANEYASLEQGQKAEPEEK